MSESATAVFEQIEKEKVRFINLQFTDFLGMVKSVTIPAHQFADSVEHGTWFDGSSIEGFARIAESDMYLQPELDTFKIIPWERGENTTARVICRVMMPDGQPFAGDPREVLLKALEEARDMGFDYYIGPELEFFLFHPTEAGVSEPLPHDAGSYFDLSTDQAGLVRKEMVNALEDMGIEVEASHHEVAIGQHEIDFRYDKALATADKAVTFKFTLKAVAEQHGLFATFMPKPIFGVNGSGMHCHQSLFHAGTNENAFYDANDEYGLSETAKQFIAGQMAHARGMTPILASLVNSYKRLVPGYEAPVYISWARANRSALIRVPKISRGKERSCRIELRFPDPSSNPYLAFAVMLKAGLDGMKRGTPLAPPSEENLYHFTPERLVETGVQQLPSSLDAALSALEADSVVQEALGDPLYDRFIEAKRAEWTEYAMQVTPWELERYLPTF
jgi:glutamine synthetase